MRERKVMKLASRGKRFGAACIDAVIPAVSCFILFITALVEIARALAFGSGYSYGFGGPGFGYGYGYGMGMSGGAVAAIIISFIMLVACAVVQFIFFNKSKTIGKAALGLQVVSSKDGEPVGFWKMLFRECLVKQASGSVFLLGFIWILIDDKNRGWHDKILDTYVVDLKESEALNEKRSAAVRDTVAEGVSAAVAVAVETVNKAGMSIPDEPVSAETTEAVPEEAVSQLPETSGPAEEPSEPAEPAEEDEEK